MIKVLKTNNDEYIVESRNKVLYSSTLKRLILILSSLDVSFEEIEGGLSELIINDHNHLEYGINRRWIFTKKVA